MVPFACEMCAEAGGARRPLHDPDSEPCVELVGGGARRGA